MANEFYFPKQTYVSRREKLMQKVGKGKILLLANDELSINFKDNCAPYRQDSTFLYFAAIQQPNIALILDCDNGQTILYGDNASIDSIVWTGPLPLLESLALKVGIQKVKSFSDLSTDLNGEVHYLPPYRGSHIVQLRKLLSLHSLQPSIPLIKAVISQRNIKSQEEILEIDKAVSLSKAMHSEIISNIAPGKYEYELVAAASQFAIANNAQWSFQPIITVNGQTLHNHYYGNKIKVDDMVLVDGGIETMSGYWGDITRTTAATGKFTSLQQDVYNSVKLAYFGAAQFAKSGTTFKDVHLHACKILVDRLKSIGWMKGNSTDAVSNGAHTLFFQCGLGHMMGLDVHDMENLGEQFVGYSDKVLKSKEFGLKSLRLGKRLEVGNVITIEPGIYIIPELVDKFESEGKFKDYVNYGALRKNINFGGIRIEDDFVVEEDSVRMLGGQDPQP